MHDIKPNLTDVSAERRKALTPLTSDVATHPAEIPAAIKPEWLRVHHVPPFFGIGRSKLYELIAEGKIKSASLRKRGQVNGTRLINYDSLAEYIESQVEDTNS